MGDGALVPTWRWAEVAGFRFRRLGRPLGALAINGNEAPALQTAVRLVPPAGQPPLCGKALVRISIASRSSSLVVSPTSGNSLDGGRVIAFVAKRSSGRGAR